MDCCLVLTNLIDFFISFWIAHSDRAMAYYVHIYHPYIGLCQQILLFDKIQNFKRKLFSNILLEIKQFHGQAVTCAMYIFVNFIFVVSTQTPNSPTHRTRIKCHWNQYLISSHSLIDTNYCYCCHISIFPRNSWKKVKFPCSINYEYFACQSKTLLSFLQRHSQWETMSKFNFACTQDVRRCHFAMCRQIEFVFAKLPWNCHERIAHWWHKMQSLRVVDYFDCHKSQHRIDIY